MKVCLAFADKGNLPYQDIIVIFGCLSFLPQFPFQKQQPENTAWDLRIFVQPANLLCRLGKALSISCLPLSKELKMGSIVSNSYEADHLKFSHAESWLAGSKDVTAVCQKTSCSCQCVHMPTSGMMLQSKARGYTLEPVQ